MRIVIAEDSVLLRAGIASLLEEAGHEVVAAVGDGDALIDAVDRQVPDLAVVDVRMPPTYTDEGLRAALRVRSVHPTTGILVLSQYVEERYAAELLATQTSGVGYLLKDRVADVREFLDALQRVGDGGTALDPEVVAQLLARSGRQDPLERLSPREREVLGLMAEGRSNAAIASALVVSDGAVEKHVTNIFSKLDLLPADQDHRRVLAVLRWLEG
jgi:DNA-binding NarL/FixJ family response regulator